MSVFSSGWLAVFALALGMPRPAHAVGVFNLYHYIESGHGALSVGPEVQFAEGAGFDFNARYNHGISDLSNVGAIIGTGIGGRKQFRGGLNMTFDVFPDIEGQLGVGIAGQGVFYQMRVRDTDPFAYRFELVAIPYIHKTFRTKRAEFEPFIAVPIGGLMQSETIDRPFEIARLLNVSFGSMFKGSEHLKYVLDFGLRVWNTESYLGVGLMYVF